MQPPNIYLPHAPPMQIPPSQLPLPPPPPLPLGNAPQSVPNTSSVFLKQTNDPSLISQYYSFVVLLSDFSVELHSKELSNEGLKSNQQKDVSSLRMNFSNYKQFITSNQSNCKILTSKDISSSIEKTNISDNNDFTVCKYEWPSFKQQFYYHTGMIDSLEKRKFVIQCFDFSN